MKNVKINNREKFPNIKLENWRKIRNLAKNQKLQRERERERERTPEKREEKKTEHRFADHGTEDRREARIRRDSRIKQKKIPILTKTKPTACFRQDNILKNV